MDRVQLWCVHVVQVFVAAVSTEFETYLSALSTHSFCFSYYFCYNQSCIRVNFLLHLLSIPFHQFHNKTLFFSEKWRSVSRFDVTPTVFVCSLWHPLWLFSPISPSLIFPEKLVIFLFNIALGLVCVWCAMKFFFPINSALELKTVVLKIWGVSHRFGTVCVSEKIGNIQIFKIYWEIYLIFYTQGCDAEMVWSWFDAPRAFLSS